MQRESPRSWHSLLFVFLGTVAVMAEPDPKRLKGSCEHFLPCFVRDALRVSAPGNPKASGKKETDEDKLVFALEALDAEDPFSKNVEPPPDVREALEWLSSVPPATVNEVRETIITGLECWAARLQESGEREAWFEGCDMVVQGVARDVNGPLLYALAAISGHIDPACIEFFRSGAPLYGMLARSGIGVHVECPGVPEVEEAMMAHCLQRNTQLIASLREDTFAAELMELTRKDAQLGRMTVPVPVEQCDLSEVLLVPRFGVDQGIQADGTVKIRAVDNFSWSPPPDDCPSRRTKKEVKVDSINGHCGAQEKLSHDHLDDLARAMAVFLEQTDCVPALWKADIDAAFRRVPLKPAHRWAAGVAFYHEGVVWVSWHNAAPFGAMSSVHSWERIGELICKIARRMLGLPVFRYVDDYFAPDRPESAEHGMQCFARLVRLLLGKGALCDRKLGCGASLEILGVELVLTKKGYTAKPSKRTVNKCLKVLEKAIAEGSLPSGAAQKLAGRLNWAGQHLFHRLGRAMLRVLYDRRRST